MSIFFQCPECREFVHVGTTLAGLHAPCPSCNVSVPVPEREIPLDSATEQQVSVKKKWEAIASQVVAPPPQPISPAVAWCTIGTIVVLIGAVVVLAVTLR